MRKLFSKFITILLFSLILTGCLTTEFKEYRFTINSDNSGSGSIKFINIVSEEDDEKDVSFADFQELINDYLQGEQFEMDNPDLHVTSKEILEENGQLCALVKFTFDHYANIDFFRYEDCQCSPMMYYAGALSETVIETDGMSFSEDESIPIYYWDPEVKEFYIKTQVKDDMTDAHGMMDLYKIWKDKQ